MKRILILLMVTAVFIGMTGCSNSAADPSEDPTTEASISADTSSDGADEEEMSSETESSRQSEASGESSEPEQSVSSSPNAGSSDSTPGTVKQETPETTSPGGSTNGGNSTPPSASTPSTPESTTPTPSTPEPSTPSTPAPTPDPVPTPAPKTAYDYPFDPEQIKLDMIAYGKDLGMKQGSASASTGAITASSSLQGTALKNALMNRVAFYANPDNLAAYGGDPVEYFDVTYSGSDGNYSFIFWY